MTGTGTVDVNLFTDPVRLRNPMAVATKRPAEAVSAAVKERAMAMEAMAFIGWTGRGMPKRVPVRMLARPEMQRVVGREMLFVVVRAMRRGRRVLGWIGG